MIIRCDVCGTDPCGRWKAPPAIIFRDPYREGGDGSVYACRDHLSAKREKRFKSGERTPLEEWTAPLIAAKVGGGNARIGRDKAGRRSMNEQSIDQRLAVHAARFASSYLGDGPAWTA
jgi:hypothetical protein